MLVQEIGIMVQPHRKERAKNQGGKLGIIKYTFSAFLVLMGLHMGVPQGYSMEHNENNPLENNTDIELFIKDRGDQNPNVKIDRIRISRMYKEKSTIPLESDMISVLPESIGNLTNLKELWLKRNKLKSLPDSIGNLTNLENLTLGDNNLESLPDSFCYLTKLRSLGLDENRLKSLPDNFGNLVNLSGLYLDDNDWESLPNSFGRLTKLKSLVLSNAFYRTTLRNYSYDGKNIKLEENNLQIFLTHYHKKMVAAMYEKYRLFAPYYLTIGLPKDVINHMTMIFIQL